MRKGDTNSMFISTLAECIKNECAKIGSKVTSVVSGGRYTEISYENDLGRFCNIYILTSNGTLVETGKFIADHIESRMERKQESTE